MMDGLRNVYYRRERAGRQWGGHIKRRNATRTLCGRSTRVPDRWTLEKPDGKILPCDECVNAATNLVWKPATQGQAVAS